MRILGEQKIRMFEKLIQFSSCMLGAKNQVGVQIWTPDLIKIFSVFWLCVI